APLLDRGPRGAEPTASGRALIKRSAVIFDELDQAVREIEFIADPTVGEIRIGSTEPLGEGLLTAAINDLAFRYPRIKFNVVQGDPAMLLSEMEGRNVELVLARMLQSSLAEHMHMEVFYRDSLVVVAGAQNPWTRRRNVKLADLLGERWTLMPGSS